MIALLTGRMGARLAAAVAILAILAGIWWLIDSRARLAVEVETKGKDIEAWERVNNADVGNADPVDDRGWLHNRGKGER